jgi:hypothetical protein
LFIDRDPRLPDPCIDRDTRGQVLICVSIADSRSVIHKSASSQMDAVLLCVSIKKSWQAIHKNAPPQMDRAHQLSVLCMAPAYSESDTQVFAKSCVSFFEFDMSIHKLTDLRSVLRTATGKNVYEKHRTDDSYTAGLRSIHSKPAFVIHRGFICCTTSPQPLHNGPHCSSTTIPSTLQSRAAVLPRERQRCDCGRFPCRTKQL